jgi:hypothetical protein
MEECVKFVNVILELNDKIWWSQISSVSLLSNQKQKEYEKYEKSC